MPALDEKELQNLEKSLTDAVTVELENSKQSIKADLESVMDEKLSQHKQEMLELSRPTTSPIPATELEISQLKRLNAALPAGAEEVTLEALRAYHKELNVQALECLKGKRASLDATIAGFAGYDDARGGALIIPEVDKKIYTDFELYDTGLMNSINFRPANSRTMRVIVDTVEPDKDVTAVKESLKEIGYELNDGWFVEATLNLKDYDAPARITYDQLEDEAFRLEPYVNGKMAEGIRVKAAKDLWFGNGAQSIKGIFNYPKGTEYGQVQVEHVATSGQVTLDDIIKLCTANRGIGALYIDRATWYTAVTAKANDGQFVLSLGYQGKSGRVTPYQVDARVPFIDMPVIFDSAFAMPEAKAANIVAAVLPPSSVVGYRRPFDRFMVKDKMKYREMLLTGRLDAVLTQFNYVKLLSGLSQADANG